MHKKVIELQKFQARNFLFTYVKISAANPAQLQWIFVGLVVFDFFQISWVHLM